jgi:hypothetical protein
MIPTENACSATQHEGCTLLLHEGHPASSSLLDPCCHQFRVLTILPDEAPSLINQELHQRTSCSESPVIVRSAPPKKVFWKGYASFRGLVRAITGKILSDSSPVRSLFDPPNNLDFRN